MPASFKGAARRLGRFNSRVTPMERAVARARIFLCLVQPCAAQRFERAISVSGIP